jgi:uncharacterized membrane protein YbhN (UPF0104 family)
MAPWTWYWISVALLAVLLFWPVSKLIWTWSVRRLERRQGRPLDARERLGQRNRAWLLAIVLCCIFSALFNYQILDMARHG